MPSFFLFPLLIEMIYLGNVQIHARLSKAQRLLKQSRSKDYYKVLGVARDADEKTIKRALCVFCPYHIVFLLLGSHFPFQPQGCARCTSGQRR